MTREASSMRTMRRLAVRAAAVLAAGLCLTVTLPQRVESQASDLVTQGRQALDAQRVDDAILGALRLLHVAAGFLALAVAPVAMAAAKGGPAHRRWGTVYYRAMVVVAVTAVVLGLARPNPFLTMIAVFSFYTAFSGYHALARKRHEAGRRDIVGAAIALLTLAVSVALIALGIAAPSPLWQRLAVVSIVLGAVGVFLSARDLAVIARPPADPMAWWYAHMTRMLGSYIAAVTAFSVVNFTFLPLTARWLWPTIVGTPLIIVWTGYYRRRFRRAPVATEEAPAACVSI